MLEIVRVTLRNRVDSAEHGSGGQHRMELEGYVCHECYTINIKTTLRLHVNS